MSRKKLYLLGPIAFAPTRSNVPFAPCCCLRSHWSLNVTVQTRSVADHRLIGPFRSPWMTRHPRSLGGPLRRAARPLADEHEGADRR